MRVRWRRWGTAGSSLPARALRWKSANCRAQATAPRYAWCSTHFIIKTLHLTKHQQRSRIPFRSWKRRRRYHRKLMLSMRCRMRNGTRPTPCVSKLTPWYIVMKIQWRYRCKAQMPPPREISMTQIRQTSTHSNILLPQTTRMRRASSWCRRLSRSLMTKGRPQTAAASSALSPSTTWKPKKNKCQTSK